MFTVKKNSPLFPHTTVHAPVRAFGPGLLTAVTPKMPDPVPNPGVNDLIAAPEHPTFQRHPEIASTVTLPDPPELVKCRAPGVIFVTQLSLCALAT